MQISSSQIINPAVYAYDDKRHKRQIRFQEAVQRAKFLDNEQKSKWKMLGYLLSTPQLQEAEHLIISEDLRRLKTRHQLEKIKPKEK